MAEKRLSTDLQAQIEKVKEKQDVMHLQTKLWQ